MGSRRRDARSICGPSGSSRSSRVSSRPTTLWSLREPENEIAADRVCSPTRSVPHRPSAATTTASASGGAMANADSSGPSRFTAELLSEATKILRSHARPHALPLLSELLCIWEKEALPEHLSLENRAAFHRRTEQLVKIREIAADLIASISALDDDGRFEVACKAELQARGLVIDEWWALAVAKAPDAIPAGQRKRDEALSWLGDVIVALQVPQPEPPPDESTRDYLIALDLGAIFHLITGEAPTRRNNPQSGPYGPFFEFLNCAKRAVPE